MAVKKVSSRKAPAKKSHAKAPAKKSHAKVAKRKAPAAKKIVRKVAATKAIKRKAPARKPHVTMVYVKKVAAKKVVAKKATTKKVAAKKVAVKKYERKHGPSKKQKSYKKPRNYKNVRYVITNPKAIMSPSHKDYLHSMTPRSHHAFLTKAAADNLYAQPIKGHTYSPTNRASPRVFVGRVSGTSPHSKTKTPTYVHKGTPYKKMATPKPLVYTPNKQAGGRRNWY